MTYSVRPGSKVSGDQKDQPLSPEELEELERLAAESGSIGKIARAWLEVEAEQ